MNAKKNAAPWIGSVVPKRMNLNDIRNALATDAGSYGGVIYSRAVTRDLRNNDIVCSRLLPSFAPMAEFAPKSGCFWILCASKIVPCCFSFIFLAVKHREGEQIDRIWLNIDRNMVPQSIHCECDSKTLLAAVKIVP